MNPHQRRIAAIRVRNWRRYVKHFCQCGCRYSPGCRIASEANRRDARLAIAQMAAADQQTGLWS